MTDLTDLQDIPRIAMITYSTKSRGGVVHTLHLTEALHSMGVPIHLFALGDPAVGFFRHTDAPHTIIPAPEAAPTLEQRVFHMVDAIAEALAQAVSGRFDIMHAQDCIGARSATRVRDAGALITVVRTVHHIDDFTTPALIECQNRSILEPDHVLVVSQYWRRLLHAEYGIDPEVVTNGVDISRFTRPCEIDVRTLRSQVGAEDRFLFLHVGGIEPRKGSITLIEALSRIRERVNPAPVLMIIGGKAFQDYSGYRDHVFERADEFGIDMRRDVILKEDVPDSELPGWYFAADAFVFPSVKEGWGIAVLEALAAGLPTVTSDIPVFHEYLTPGRDVVMTPVNDSQSLAEAMIRIMTDATLRSALQDAGPRVAGRYSWNHSAEQHRTIYQRLARTPATSR